jgi:hypothetical protein
MEWFNQFVVPIGYDVFKAFVGALFALLIAGPIRNWWQHRRHGNWTVIVNKNGKPLVTRKVGTKKSMSIKDDEADLSVFLKGIVSAYDQLNVDLVTTGRQNGLLNINHDRREYVIELANNPPKSAKDRQPVM